MLLASLRMFSIQNTHAHTYVRVSDEDRGVLFQQPGQSGGDARAASKVKGCHSSLGLVGIEEESGSRGRGKQEFGEGGRVACLDGGVKGRDESGGREGGGREGREGMRSDACVEYPQPRPH